MSAAQRGAPAPSPAPAWPPASAACAAAAVPAPAWRSRAQHHANHRQHPQHVANRDARTRESVEYAKTLRIPLSNCSTHLASRVPGLRNTLTGTHSRPRRNPGGNIQKSAAQRQPARPRAGRAQFAKPAATSMFARDTLADAAVAPGSSYGGVMRIGANVRVALACTGTPAPRIGLISGNTASRLLHPAPQVVDDARGCRPRSRPRAA